MATYAPPKQSVPRQLFDVAFLLALVFAALFLPIWLKIAVPLSLVNRVTSPPSQTSSTARIRGNSGLGSSFGLIPRRVANQPRISAAVGSAGGATTVASTTRASIVSNAPATRVRHGVIRVQARSVSPGA